MNAIHEVSVDPRQLERAMRLGATIVSGGPPYLGWVSDRIDIEIGRLTFNFKRLQASMHMLLARISSLNANAKTPVLVMTGNPYVQESLAACRYWWGWTVLARDCQLYSIQRVLFLRPSGINLLGETDQGEIYEIENGQLSPWGGEVVPSATAA